jgi:hypothetical protein
MNQVHSNRLFKSFFGAAGLMIAIALAAVAYYWFAVVRLGELQTKDPYSFLQDVEMENRDIEVKSGPIFLDKVSAMGFSVLGHLVIHKCSVRQFPVARVSFRPPHEHPSIRARSS